MSAQANKRPDQISGGQKQRVAVARALATNAQLVLADEPTANLDHDTAYRVIELMKKMRDELGTTFVFSTHDPKIMAEAEVIFTLEDGRIRQQSAASAAERAAALMLNILKIAARNLAALRPAHAADFDAHHPGHRQRAAVRRRRRIVQGDDDRPVHRCGPRPPRGAPPGLCRLDRHAAAEPQHVGPTMVAQGRAGARQPWTTSKPIRSASSSAPCSAISPRRRAFASTASIPAREVATTPLLPGRVIDGSTQGALRQAGRDPHSGAARPGHEGQGRRHHRARRHQPGRLGQRQDLHRPGDPGERHRPERARRLHPHRGRAHPAADEGAARSARSRSA